MALPIIEEPLYGRIVLETTAISGAFSWVDQSQYITSASYQEGRTQLTLGDVGPEVGTLSASFKNMSVVPSSGHYVRIRRAGTTEYFFTGYIQDVSQRIIFDDSVSLTTPLTITTITALDWVGLLTQVQVNGIDGRDAGGTALSGGHWMEDRVRALNYQFDTSGGTELIEVTTFGSGTMQLGCTDFGGSIADHLDLAARSSDAYWFGNHLIPTNATNGRDKMVSYRKWSTNVSTNKTFTDVAGSAGQLHYTEIDFESSSANVANTVNITNHALVRPGSLFTKIGGGNEENYLNINNTRQIVGTLNDEEWVVSDATSVSTYGPRRVEIETCRDAPIFQLTGGFSLGNLVPNGSLEYSDDGYSTGGSATIKGRRRIPSFGAAYGSWAFRGRATVAGGTSFLKYTGGESDAIPVIGGAYYQVQGSCARDTTSTADMRVRVDLNWYDEDENSISTTSSGYTNLTNANQWYTATLLAVAPANAVRATIAFVYNRSGGTNIRVGDMQWLDAVWMTPCNSTGTGLSGATYFDGDTANTGSVFYMWTGQVGASQSLVLENTVKPLGADLAARFGTTSVRATRIRWNAQEDLTAVSSLVVGKTISLVYKGTTTTYRIIGTSADVSPDRYMIDYYLWKV